MNDINCQQQKSVMLTVLFKMEVYKTGCHVGVYRINFLQDSVRSHTEMCGSEGRKHEQCFFLRRDAVWSGTMVPTSRKKTCCLHITLDKVIFTVMNLCVPQKVGTLDRLNDSTQASNNFYSHHF